MTKIEGAVAARDAVSARDLDALIERIDELEESLDNVIGALQYAISEGSINHNGWRLSGKPWRSRDTGRGDASTTD